MKKNIIFAAAAAASTILLSLSCTKQDEIQSESEAKIFTGSIEQIQTKTVLVDEVKVNWSEGDNVCIISTSDGKVGIYSATPKANGTAEFTKIKGDEPQGPDYFAVYPATLFQGEGLDFPKYQKYESGKLNAPMFAFSPTEKLTFKNMCGVVCFALTGSVEIESIELWADGVALCGATEVNTEKGKAKTIGTPSDENNKVILKCLDAKKNGVQLDTKDPTYFYIYLPETTFEAGTLHASIIGVEDGSMDLKSGSKVTVEANNIYTFEYTINGFDSSEPAIPAEEDVERIEMGETSILPGEFTVDADGTKVKFTSGNLLWTSESGWTVETSQKGTYRSTFDENNVDLFLWTDNYEQAILAKGNITPTTPYLFCDDNVALFNNGTTDLHVLDNNQWNYLLNSRSGNRFAKVRFNGMLGLLLFPDEVTQEMKEGEIASCLKEGSMSEINNDKEEFPSEGTEIAENVFNALENAGFVFLPADGARIWTGEKVKIDNVPDKNEQANGEYWGTDGNSFCVLEFGNHGVDVIDHDGMEQSMEQAVLGQLVGASIRLVQIIPAAQEVQGSGQTQRD